MYFVIVHTDIFEDIMCQTKKTIILLLLCIVTLIFYSCRHKNDVRRRHHSDDDLQVSQVNYMEDQSLEQFIQEIKTFYNLPGIATITFKSDGILESAGVGSRLSKQEESITLDDLFHIGSCAESMTAALVAILVEEGVL